MKSKKRPVPTTRRPFRIEKLEERVAPKKGGNGTHNCGGTANCTSFGSGGSGY